MNSNPIAPPPFQLGFWIILEPLLDPFVPLFFQRQILIICRVMRAFWTENHHFACVLAQKATQRASEAHFPTSRCVQDISDNVFGGFSNFFFPDENFTQVPSLSSFGQPMWVREPGEGQRGVWRPKPPTKQIENVFLYRISIRRVFFRSFCVIL